MEQLDEFFDYKNKLIEDLLTDEEIVKLIDESRTLETAPTLVYDRVYPYEFVPETVQQGHTFVCCDVDIDSVPNQTYLSATLYIWEFTHKSKLRLETGGVRTDKLASKITEAINGSFEYGLGRLKLLSIKRVAPMTDFQGKLLIFRTTDFNNTSPIGKKPPANRKGF